MVNSLLSSLIQLSKIDVSLARIFAEKKAIEKELTEKELALKKALQEKALKQKIATERRTRYVSEEKGIKEEHEKIEERRKALNTLHNYKLQQAAIREIDYGARQLKVREDSLLKLLEETEQAEASLKQFEEGVLALDSALTQLRNDSSEGLVALEKQRTEKMKSREALLPAILPANLQQYDRVKSRFPADPMLPVSGGACTGCRIQVAAQLMVQIHMGDQIVKCRGCGRFIFLDLVPAADEKSPTA